MLSTALSVRGWRRIGMGVRRLLIWGVVGRICFIRRRILGIIDEWDGIWEGGLLGFVGRERCAGALLCLI